MKILKMAVMVWMAHAAAHGSDGRQKLTVCLRVDAVERRMITPRAKELAARMFADIGISLEWMAWERACEVSQAPIFIEVRSAAPEEYRPDALAYALPYRSHITVFLDRIETMESPAIVLAHVMVHEITHVVQGVCRHSETGLMKAHWGRKDLLEMLRTPLPFAPEDLVLFQSGLATREEVTGTLPKAR
jgi:hypothetical protein